MPENTTNTAAGNKRNTRCQVDIQRAPCAGRFSQHTMGARPAEPSVTVTAAPRILVVDDTPALLDVIRKCLEEEGYYVRTCLESRNAVRMARDDPPDMIMLDVVM